MVLNGAQGRNRTGPHPAVRVRHRQEDFQPGFNYYNLAKSVTFDIFLSRLCQLMAVNWAQNWHTNFVLSSSKLHTQALSFLDQRKRQRGWIF